MVTKTFGDKKITIRKITKSDLKIEKKFRDFVNSLVREEAKLSTNKEYTKKEETEFIKKMLQDAKDKKSVYMLAECDGEIIASTSINQQRGRMSHVGLFGIMIADGFRGLGLGKYLTQEIIKQAQKDLNPKPKIIKLEVYVNNTHAIKLYEKSGFKNVARIPKQMNWKDKLIDIFVMLKYL